MKSSGFFKQAVFVVLFLQCGLLSPLARARAGSQHHFGAVKWVQINALPK